MHEIIKVSSLSKSYGTMPAVDHLSLSIRCGTIYGLLGANGAGKSTTIECILGTKQPDSGTIEVLGYHPKKDRCRLFEHVGVQFQECGYPPEIRVSELCEETACLYKNPVDPKVLCTRFGIGDKENSAVKDLSGGERQRLFIVLALIPNPKLVILDELTTGLDVSARRAVWKILLSLKAEGKTILLSSHFMDEVETLCDEICILKKGKTVFCGTVDEAKERSGCTSFEDAYLDFSGEEVV